MPTTAEHLVPLAEVRDSQTEGRKGYSVQRFVSGHGLTHLDLFSGIGGFALAEAPC